MAMTLSQKGGELILQKAEFFPSLKALGKGEDPN
jgi:hypothetical protein